MAACCRIAALGYFPPRLPCVKLRVCIPRRREALFLAGKIDLWNKPLRQACGKQRDRYARQ